MDSVFKGKIDMAAKTTKHTSEEEWFMLGLGLSLLGSGLTLNILAKKNTLCYTQLTPDEMISILY